MGPEVVLGINALIRDKKPKSFDEFRSLVNETEWKDLSDSVLEAFGFKKDQPAPVIEQTEQKKKPTQKVTNKTMLEQYIELVSEVRTLYNALRKDIETVEPLELCAEVLNHLEALINKHKENIKGSEIWN